MKTVRLVAIGLLALGCRHERSAEAQPIGQTQIDSVELPRSGSTSLVPFDEDRDRALVVAGNAEVHTPIVYLHGMCADPKADLEAFGAIARAQGTIIALQGDVPCPGQPGRTRWSDDLLRLDGRISLAITAVNSAGIGPFLIDGEILVVGSSLGASRAEALAGQIPARYSRVVLVSAPKTPTAASLASARAVATVAGDLEPQRAMRDGARVLAQSGVPARFFLLPGATHGRFGPDGARVMAQAVAFVRAR